MIDFSEDFTEVQQAESNSNLWVNKYRPKKLQDMCLDDNLRSIFESQIKDGDIRNVTLVGPPGTGKTTMALVLVNEIHGEPLFISCASGEGKVDTIGMKIIPFCQYASNNRKVIILDELDSASATQASSFQKALRNVIEAYPECRFIATANYKENIIDPILSRLPPLTMSFSAKQMYSRIVEIFKKEHVDYSSIDQNEFKDLVHTLIRHTYPDIRALMGRLEMACIDTLTTDKLKALAHSDTNLERYASFFDKIIKVIKNSNPVVMRSSVNNLITSAISNGLDEDGILSSGYNFSRALFNYVLEKDLIKSVDILIQLTGQLNTIETCVDKEPQVFRMLLLLFKGLS